MSSQRSVRGRLVHLAVIALLVACSADGPEPSPDPASTDSSYADVSKADSPAEMTASSGQNDQAEPAADLVTPDGWGPLRIGMSKEKVVAAAGEDANPDAVGGAEPEYCDEFRPASAPNGILVMIEKGVLTRVSVSRNAAVRTPEGFRVGDLGSDVIEAYGSRAQVDPHKYWEPPAKYITIWRETSATGDRRGIRYEIDPDGEIVHIRVGGPSIEYVEGCL